MKSFLIPDMLLIGATYNETAGSSPEPCQGGLAGSGESQKCTFLVEVLKYPDVPSWHVTSGPHQAVLFHCHRQT